MTAQLPPFALRPLSIERYRRLGAQTDGDSQGGWMLAGLVDAKASMYDDAEHVARDAPDGRSGWETAADPLTCRRAFLPWAAQMYGVSVPVENVAAAVPDTVVDAERQRVAQRGLFRRGSTEAIIAALAVATTGARRPLVRLRYDPAHPAVDSAWHTTLIYRSADVTDMPRLLALAGSPDVKPAGLIVHVLVQDRRDYDQSTMDFPTYTARSTGNVSYDDTGTF